MKLSLVFNFYYFNYLKTILFYQNVLLLNYFDYFNYFNQISYSNIIYVIMYFNLNLNDLNLYYLIIIIMHNQ